MLTDNAKAKEQIAELKEFVAASRPTSPRRARPPSRAARSTRSRSRTSSPPAASTRSSASNTTSGKSCTAWRWKCRSWPRATTSLLFHNLNLPLEAGERIAIIGPNGIGKTTLLRCLVGDLEPDHGDVKWAEKAKIGYFAQDHAADFDEDEDADRLDGPVARRKSDDDQIVRGTLGRLLFSGDDVEEIGARCCPAAKRAA